MTRRLSFKGFPPTTDANQHAEARNDCPQAGSHIDQINMRSDHTQGTWHILAVMADANTNLASPTIFRTSACLTDPTMRNTSTRHITKALTIKLLLEAISGVLFLLNVGRCDQLGSTSKTSQRRAPQTKYSRVKLPTQGGRGQTAQTAEAMRHSTAIPIRMETQ